MRRSFWLVLAALAALAVAAIALAASSLSTKSVTATFTAAASAGNKTTTCTGTDGDYTRIRGQYTGTSTSTDARLAGPITVKGESLVNKTTGLGWMKGTVRIDTTSDEDTKANFTAVISGGQLNGFLNGRVHDPSGRLLGGIQAAFSSTTGVGAGSLGSTGSTPALIVTGGCDNGKHEGHGKGHGKKH